MSGANPAPALLAAIGRRMDGSDGRYETVGSGAWSSWACRVVRRTLLEAGLALVLLGPLTARVFGLKVGSRNRVCRIEVGLSITVGCLPPGP